MKLWIDCDMGFDDLAAIALCRHQGSEIEGISLVAGNAPLAQVLLNAMDASSAFSWDMPLYLGAEAPLKAPLLTADYVLGATALPTVGRSLPRATLPRPPQGEVLPALIAYLEGGGETVLALGPLTNIALLLQERPDLAAKMRLVWMGGAFARGNHTAVAEFNAAVDPEAIEVVLASGADMTMVSLECCRDVSVTLEALKPIRALKSEGAALVGDLYEGYIRIAGNGSRPMALYDPVAAAVAINPELFDYQHVFMQAETEGRHTRGMTVIEWRSHKADPNARVALNPKADTITTCLTAALIKMAKEYDKAL